MDELGQHCACTPCASAADVPFRLGGPTVSRHLGMHDGRSSLTLRHCGVRCDAPQRRHVERRDGEVVPERCDSAATRIDGVRGHVEVSQGVRLQSSGGYEDAEGPWATSGTKYHTGGCMVSAPTTCPLVANSASLRAAGVHATSEDPSAVLAPSPSSTHAHVQAGSVPGGAGELVEILNS